MLISAFVRFPLLSPSGSPPPPPPSLHCSGNGVCPPQWHLQLGSCYYLQRLKKHWLDAKGYCEQQHVQDRINSRRGYLVTISSQAENDYVVALNQGRHENIWIGYNDRGTEGIWVWSHRSPTNMYTNWIKGNPNNANRGQDCAVINMRNRKPQWDDQGCKYLEVSVCEIGEERFKF